MMITVVDVYDVAAAIGKDFEVIIDRFGVDAVSQLMPKVISVLEELEDMAIRQEQETHEISSLKSAVARLEAEKLARALDRTRYEKELEQIEETWRGESQELLKLVDSLQEENRRLTARLSESGVELEASEAPGGQITSDQLTFVNQLQDMIRRQRLQIRQIKSDVAQKEMELDAMLKCSEHAVLEKVNLKRRFCVDRKPSDKLREEETDLEAQLEAKEQLIEEMRVKLQSIGRQASRGSTAEDTTVAQSPSTDGFSSERERRTFVERINADDKMLPGSEGAQFSTEELRQTLSERCQLRLDLTEVREELSVYRLADDEDRPVQGPINREPDEKLRPGRGKEYGIKSLFNRLMDRLHD